MNTTSQNTPQAEVLLAGCASGVAVISGVAEGSGVALSVCSGVCVVPATVGTAILTRMPRESSASSASSMRIAPLMPSVSFIFIDATPTT